MKPLQAALLSAAIACNNAGEGKQHPLENGNETNTGTSSYTTGTAIPNGPNTTATPRIDCSNPIEGFTEQWRLATQLVSADYCPPPSHEDCTASRQAENSAFDAEVQAQATAFLGETYATLDDVAAGCVPTAQWTERTETPHDEVNADWVTVRNVFIFDDGTTQIDTSKEPADSSRRIETNMTALVLNVAIDTYQAGELIPYELTVDAVPADSLIPTSSTSIALEYGVHVNGFPVNKETDNPVNVLTRLSNELNEAIQTEGTWTLHR